MTDLRHSVADAAPARPDDLPGRMRRVAHFQRLSDAELRDIIAAGQVRAFPADTAIFNEGEACAGLHVLLSGQVQLCKHSLQGQMSIVALIEPVIMFNEVAALDRGPNPYTAMTASDSMVWRVDAAGMDQILSRYPALALGLLRILAARNRLLMAQFEDLSFRSVLARTAKLILQLSKEGAEPIDRRRHPNHRLAAQISTVPEAFSRALKLLRQEGVISCAESAITVIDPARLAEQAQVIADAALVTRLG